MSFQKPPAIHIPLTQRTGHPGAGPVAAPEGGHARVGQHVAQAEQALQQQRQAIPDAIAHPLSPVQPHQGHLPQPDMVLNQPGAVGNCIPKKR